MKLPGFTADLSLDSVRLDGASMSSNYDVGLARPDSGAPVKPALLPRAGATCTVGCGWILENNAFQYRCGIFCQE